MIFGQNSASARRLANSPFLHRRNGHNQYDVSLASTLQKNLPQTLCSRRVKKPMDLFPRVPRTDPILFIERCHSKMRVCSRPLGCKITTLMIGRSNVSTSHWCQRFKATSLVRHLVTRPPSFSDLKTSFV